MADRSFELGTLGAYLALLLWIGFRSARQVKTSEDFTLSGRDVPWIVLLATTAATMIGGGASIGMVAKVAEVGIAAALVTCAWHLQLIFTGLFIAPRLRGLNVVTVGDFFEVKFGSLAREIAVVNCAIFLIGALAAQMAAIGTVANSILGVPYDVALLIGAMVTIFYSTIGGIRAVVKTDTLQFVILVFGIGTASAILFAKYGGFWGMEPSASVHNFHVTGNLSTTRVVSWFFAFLVGETFVPPYAVRCFIAQDARHARWGVAGAGIFLLLFLPLATIVLGTAVQVDPEVQQALGEKSQEIQAIALEKGEKMSPAEADSRALQIAVPTLIRTTFHPAFAGIMVAAIIAAVMSSGDSCLSCLATVVMEDVYRRHLRPQATDSQLLRVAQYSTLLTGIAATGCAWRFSNIAEILEFVYDFWAPAMVLPFFVAVFWYDQRRIYAVVASMVSGMLASVAWRFRPPAYEDVGPALFGCGVAVLVFFLVLPMTSGLPLLSRCQPVPRSNPQDPDGPDRVS